MSWKTQKLKLGLNNFFKKKSNLQWELASLTPTNGKVKSISNHCRHFPLRIFSSQATLVAYIFQKMVAGSPPHPFPLLKSFQLYGPVTVSIYPKVTLN